MPGRIIDTRDNETLICLHHNCQAYWIENSKITNGNYNRAYTNINGDEWIADGTQVAATSEKLLIEQQLHKLRHEWSEEDAKHVQWSPAFDRANAGLLEGNRALVTLTGEPCEILSIQEQNYIVAFPWRKTIEQCGVKELEPYSYVKSCTYDKWCQL